MITFHIASRRQPFTVHEDGAIECCVRDWDRAINTLRVQTRKRRQAEKATNGTPNNNTQPL